MESRRWLEVLKFLSPKEVLLTVVSVSHALRELGTSDELWHSFIDLREESFAPVAKNPLQHYRNTSQLFLPILTSNHLHKFSFATGHITKIKLNGTNSIDHTSVWVWLPGDVIMCAGAESHELVYRLRPPYQELERLPDMTQMRGWFAILYYNNFVHVFGGFFTGWRFTNKCEMFSLQSEQWTQMPEMVRERSSFNACRWRQQVFLCGGWTTDESEVFDFNTQTFTLLPFRMPKQSRTLCWVKDATLVILQGDEVYRWSIPDSRLSPPTQNQALESYTWTNTPPVEFAGKLYYLKWDNGKGYEFNLATNEARKVIKNLFPKIY